MFRKIALALIATSLLAAPALAKNTAKTTPAPTSVANTDAVTPQAKPVIKAKAGKRHRHIARHYRHHRTHMIAGKFRHHVFAGKHRTHVRHFATVKPGKTLKVTNARPHKTHVHRVVKVKKPIKTHRTAALKPALRTGKVVKRGA